MSMQIPGKIFLADQRGLSEDAQFRRFCTFSFGDFQHEHKSPVGRLRVLNEEWLAGAGRQQVTLAEAAHVLLLPITGSLKVQTDAAPTTVAVEEALVATVHADSTMHFINPYPTETISFLHLQLATEPVSVALNQRFGFDFDTLDNGLVEIIAAKSSGLPFSLSLGRFAGRQEVVYTVKQPGSQFYAFVIAGAFELEGRLLHEKDGLALWDVTEVEIEALSNNALLLVVELQQ